MRTTVTLDPDVEDLIRRAMGRRRHSFKRVVNDALRKALRHEVGGTSDRFTVDARPMGLRAGIDPVRLRDLADELDADEYRRSADALRVAEP